MLRFVAILLAASFLALPAAAQRPPTAGEGDGERFAARAAAASLAGVQLGRLALTRSFDPDIRTLARRMVEDFRGISEALADLAQRQGADLPKEAPHDATVRAQSLTGLSGDAFDRAFGTHAVRLHSEVLALFRDQAETGTGDMKQFAAERLAMLRHRLQMADVVARHQTPPAGPTIGQQMPPAQPRPEPPINERRQPRRQQPAVLVPYPIPQ